MREIEPAKTLLLRLALAGLLTGGCGGPPLCAQASDCSAGQVCGHASRCVALGSPLGTRFAGSRWVEPTDWGVAGGVDSLDDTLPVGGRGGSEPLLAFSGLPESSQILQALLVLSPHDRQPRLPRRVELVVEQVEPFRGGALPSRGGAQPLRFAAARRAVPEGPARTLRFDVTGAARNAAAREDERLYLLVRLRDPERPSAILFASPFHVDVGARPRLELLVH